MKIFINFEFFRYGELRTFLSASDFPRIIPVGAINATTTAHALTLPRGKICEPVCLIFMNVCIENNECCI